MSTTTYSAQTPARASSTLGDLATACKRLMTAVVAKVAVPAAAANARRAQRTAEAAHTRGMASRWARVDHRMAADICCAADRHETSGE